MRTVQEVLTQNGNHIFEVGKSFWNFATSMGADETKCYRCAYCLLASIPYLHEGRKPKHLEIGAPPTHLSPYLRNLPVAVNNAYGDPGIQWANTVSKLDQLSNERHSGPVVLITKSHLNRGKIDDLNFPGLNLMAMVSVSKLGSPVEPPNYTTRIDTMGMLTEKGIPTVAYFRPLIPGLNDDSDTIRQVLDDTQSVGVKTLYYTGLMGTNEVLDSLQIALGFRQPPPPGFQRWEKDLKLMDPRARREIEDGAKERGIKTFRKTSCAVTEALDLGSDYNVHLAKNPIKYNCHECDRLPVCEESLTSWQPERAKVLRDVLDVDYQVDTVERRPCELAQVCHHSTPTCVSPSGHRIKLNGTYTLGEVALSRMLTGAHVYADKIIETNQLVFPFGEIDRRIEKE